MLRRHIWWLAPLAGAAVAGGVVAAVSLGGGSSAKTSPKTSHARLKPGAAALAFQNAITAVVHELSPSVVQIQTSQGLGSGVVFDSDGDIVTNNHVIGSDTGSFTVTAGARSYGASLVGRFAPDDLAVVHVSNAQLTPAADVYSLGAILFDLFTGRPPFLGEHALAVIQQASEKPAPKLRSLAPALDRDLETICAKCLEREPQVRYQSADALAGDPSILARCRQ